MQIEKLNISGCSSISQEAFLSFALNQKHLKSLQMPNSRKIFAGLSQESEAVFTALTSLEEVNLSENSVQYFNKISTMKNLRSLVMDSLDSPGSSLASGFKSLKTSQIHTWRARFLSIQSHDLQEIFQKW